MTRMNDGFSTERYCPNCEETKHWKQYHLEVGLCTVCYRDSLNNPVVLKKGKPKKPYTMTDLLADLDKYATVSDADA